MYSDHFTIVEKAKDGALIYAPEDYGYHSSLFALQDAFADRCSSDAGQLHADAVAQLEESMGWDASASTHILENPKQFKSGMISFEGLIEVLGTLGVELSTVARPSRCGAGRKSAARRQKHIAPPICRCCQFENNFLRHFCAAEHMHLRRGYCGKLCGRCVRQGRMR